MARIRTIKPEFFAHEAMASLPPHARLLALGLLCLADREGRLRWLPAQILGNVFPFEPDTDIDHLRRGLEAIGYLHTYQNDGKTFCHVRNFGKHQRISGTELKAKVFTPPPPPYCRETAILQAGNTWKHLSASSGSVGVLPVEASQCFPEIGKGNRGTEEIGTGEKGNGKSISCGEVSPRPTDEPDDHEPKSPKEPIVYPDPFLAFWNIYPLNKDGRKRGKAVCFDLWRRIPAADRNALLTATQNYAHGATVGDGFVRDPERFLKKDFWRDYIDAAEAVAMPLSQQDPRGNLARAAAFLAQEQEREHELF